MQLAVSPAIPYATGVTALCLAFGALALFGSDDDPDLERLARHLDAEPTVATLERRIEQLTESIDRLVADADLEGQPGRTPAPDAPSVEKAQALATAIDRDYLTIRPPTEQSTDDGRVARAATQVDRERPPSSETAQQLLTYLTTPESASQQEIRETLESVVETIDTARTVREALVDVDDPERVRRQLDHTQDGELVAGVQTLAEELVDARDRADRASDSRNDLESSAKALVDAADYETDPTRPLAVQLRTIANQLERGGGDADGPQASVAEDVRRERSPRSDTARTLLERLADGDHRALEEALSETVTELDEAATTRSVLESVDRNAVQSLADDVATSVADLDAPMADAIEDRVADLRETLDRADETNRVLVYAIRHELRFYDQTLVPHLRDESRRSATGGGSDAGGTDEDVAERLADVTERREAVESEYIDGRSDHNHTIPLYFLSLVDALREEAEQSRASGDPARANGILDAAEETLDHVEGLYERNAYSVLLRRLRG